MQINDKGTLSRGSHKGHSGVILSIDEAHKKLAVKLESGELLIVSQNAFKAPEEPSVSLSVLARALNDAQLPADNEVTAVVLDHLNRALPGLIDEIKLAGETDAGHPLNADPSFQ